MPSTNQAQEKPWWHPLEHDGERDWLCDNEGDWLEKADALWDELTRIKAALREALDHWEHAAKGRGTGSWERMAELRKLTGEP